ncbi:MAG TPA: VCBS repeat-containing protein [Vicinamibacterales bacterium]|nr:VCBS repeat-containing protein [Vicinamibacterales bacterium]
MRSIHRALAVVCLATLLVTGLSVSTDAIITRAIGPTTLFSDGLLLIKFDVAFDSVNQVYLQVWGTQNSGPTKGQFLSIDGLPIGGVFPISLGGHQAGWARVEYSPQQQRFLVVYTKLVGGSPAMNERDGRYVTYSNGTPIFSDEILIDFYGGHPGDATGLAYSPAANKFFVTWWKYAGSFPQSFVAAVDSSGVVTSRWQVTDPNDGQSDPEIACNPQGRCLVVGWAWSVFTGANTTWGRFVDGPEATPAGATSFLMDPFPLQGNVVVAYNPNTGGFQTAFVRNYREIWGNTININGGLGAPYLIKSSFNSNVDGGGFGTIDLAYNSGTATFVVAMASWTGFSCAQELDGAGAPVPSAFDLLPTPEPNYELRTKGLGIAADPVNGRYLLADNQAYTTFRSTRFDAGAVVPPPPPPPPPVPHDLVVYRGDGTWSLRTAASGFSAIENYGWGSTGDVPVKGDFDGDGHPDLVNYRPANGNWFIRLSSNNYDAASYLWFQWGNPGDVPIAADFDGDRKTDLVVYRPSDGSWFIRYSSLNWVDTSWSWYQWGVPGDVPLAGDFDGDRKADLVVYRPTDGNWFIRTSTSSYANWTSYNWGATGDMPLAGDFDGDGMTELAVYRPSNGYWFIRFSSQSYAYNSWVGYGWGAAGDVPVIADTDGDGKAELIVWRPSDGTWWIRRSSTGYALGSVQVFQLGSGSDLALGHQ